MSPQNPDDCLFAAKRQTQIASLFYRLLLTSLAGDPPSSKKRNPDIETQAYFEGLITSAKAAEEKLTRGSGSKIGTYTSWQDKIPGAVDLHALRNCMVHYGYDKISGGSKWEVTPLDKADTGDKVVSRSLDEYAQIAFDYANYLESLIDSLER